MLLVFSIICHRPTLTLRCIHVFCCATKACCAKFRVGNQGPTTRWDSDGTNGPNTVRNSETILLDWWTTGDNWSKYRGGKGDNGKTGITKKEQTWKKLLDEIKKAGITATRNARAVGAKIARMESEYTANKKLPMLFGNVGCQFLSFKIGLHDCSSKQCWAIVTIIGLQHCFFS
jgi:hypothetical protein